MTTSLGADDDRLFAEIHDLVTASLRGELSAANAARLEQLVLHDPRAKRIYVSYLQDTVTLEYLAQRSAASAPANVPSAADEPSSLPRIQVSPPRPSRRRSSIGGYLLAGFIAATLLGALVVGLQQWNLPPEGPAAIQSVALIRSAIAADWASAELSMVQALPAGRLKLNAGLVDIELPSGSRMIVSGPAEFEIHQANGVRFYSGQLVARVPARARGFTVITPDATMVDLGTEFGIRVADAHQSQLHVFEGQVRGSLQAPVDLQQIVIAGAAVALDRDARTIQPIPLDMSGFVRSFPQPGLKGEYFDERNLTKLKTVRIDPQIDFTSEQWNLAPPGTQVQPDGEYSVRWSGYVSIEEAGEWTFTTSSNDGVRLWIGDQQLISHWVTHPLAEISQTIHLSAGWHPIRLEYFQRDLAMTMILSYAGPGRPRCVIPATKLSTIDPTAPQSNPAQ